MKTLIIHHLEPRWETDYRAFSGEKWDFYTLSEAVSKHIRQHKYDQVILTQSRYTRLNECIEYQPLYDKITAQYEYQYGWNIYHAVGEPRSIDGAYGQLEESGYIIGSDGNIWARGGAHSELVRIDAWMEALPKSNVYICGAFDGSCIEDLEKALEHLEITYTRVEELII